MNKSFSILFVLVVSLFLSNCNAHLQLNKIDRSKFLSTKRITRSSPEYIEIAGSYQFGQFYANLSLGTPPQTFQVTVDTGSSDLVIYGSQCANCQNSDTFNIGSSSTATVVTYGTAGYACNRGLGTFDGTSNACLWQDDYGIGEINGSAITEVFTFGNYQNVRASLGYVTSRSKDFETSDIIDGLWGIAYQPLSFVPVTAIDNLITSNTLYNGFSMCLNDDPYMSIGVDYSTNNQFVWTPITSETYYNIQLNDMKVEGTSLGLPSQDYSSPICIVDSGTTLLYVNDVVFNALYDSFDNLNLVGVSNVPQSQSIFYSSNCYTMTGAQLAAYPNISITLGGSTGGDLIIPSSSYLIPFTQNNKVYYCLALQSSGTSGTILGDTLMTQYHVVFDRQKAQVGFGPLSSCPTGSYSSSTRNTPMIILYFVVVAFILSYFN